MIMKIQLSDHFTYKKLFRFTLPSVVMMIFTSIYGVVDGFFVTAGKPQLGLTVTIISGVSNMVLDALLVAVFDFGLSGAAAATAISQCIGGIVPVIYFLCPNSSLLRLTKTKFYGRSLLVSCINGSSELMSNISMSLIGMLYNVQLMKFAGEGGVAAYGVLMYVNMIFLAAFIGYSVGTAPVIGYSYGAKNSVELKNMFKKSFIIIGTLSVIMFASAKLLARWAVAALGAAHSSYRIICLASPLAWIAAAVLLLAVYYFKIVRRPQYKKPKNEG